MLFTFYLIDKVNNSKKTIKHLEFERAQDLYYDVVAVYLDVDKFTAEEYIEDVYEVEDVLDGEMRGRFGVRDDIIGGYFAEDSILENYYMKAYKL